MRAHYQIMAQSNSFCEEKKKPTFSFWSSQRACYQIGKNGESDALYSPLFSVCAISLSFQ